jgi:hypothetical protein
MAGSRTDAELRERGAFELKGLPEPVTVWQVLWDAYTEGDEDAALPPRLVSPDPWPFSGRVPELSKVRELWDDVSAGSCRAVLVRGEPGIGKTRLAAELARYASGDGALVLYGQCDADLARPFQPFAEALDRYLDQAADLITGRFPGDLSRLSGRVRDRVPEAPPPLSADGDTERHRLFDAVASWLCALADVQPVLLVVDDIHWATKATLHLLRHLLREVDETAMLVFVGYRDTDLERARPLAEMLAEFRRVPGVERLALTGFDESDVAEFLTNVTRHDASVDERITGLASVLMAESEGNPFFLGEVVRHVTASGVLAGSAGRSSPTSTVEDLGLPESVREIVGQRLDLLGEETRAVLTSAALVGREFDVAVLAELHQTTAEDVVDLLDDAVRARIVEEVGFDHFRFSHALVRATLTDDLGGSRRLRLHQRIAMALERVDPGNDLAIAHHSLEAAGAGDAERAIAYASRAAQAAVDAGAYDDAAALYRRALSLCEDGNREEDRRELLVDLAMALYLVGAPDAVEATDEAIAAARASDDVERLVRGAIIRGQISTPSTVVDEHAVEVMREALTRTGEGMIRERARLLIRLAHVQAFEGSGPQVDLAEEALALAREVDDPELLVIVGGLCLYVIATPDNLDRRLALAREIEELGSGLVNVIARHLALHLDPAWEAGQLDWVERNLADKTALFERVPYRRGQADLLMHRAKHALFTGDVAAAERDAEELLARFGDMPGAFDMYAALIGPIRCEEGRAGEVLELVEQLRGQVAGGGVAAMVRAFHGFVLAQVGDLEAAAGMLRVDASVRFAGQQRDLTWWAYQATWAEVAAEVGDRDAAGQLQALLVPFVDRIASFPAVAFGSVARHVGRLETVLGSFDDAGAHLAMAAARHDEWGAPLYLARTWADQAELLLTRDGAAAAAEADALLDRARGVAHERQAPGLDHYVDRVQVRTRSRTIGR